MNDTNFIFQSARDLPVFYKVTKFQHEQKWFVITY